MPRSEFLPYIAVSAAASTSRTPPPDERAPDRDPIPFPIPDATSAARVKHSPTKPSPSFSPPKRNHILSVKGKEREHDLSGAEGSSSEPGLVGAGGGPVTWRHLMADKVGPA